MECLEGIIRLLFICFVKRVFFINPAVHWFEQVIINTQVAKEIKALPAYPQSPESRNVNPHMNIC